MELMEGEKKKKKEKSAWELLVMVMEECIRRSQAEAEKICKTAEDLAQLSGEPCNVQAGAFTKG